MISSLSSSVTIPTNGCELRSRLTLVRLVEQNLADLVPRALQDLLPLLVRTAEDAVESAPSLEVLMGDVAQAAPTSRSMAAMARDFALAERPVSVICPSILTSLERWSSSVIGLEGHHAVRENLS